MRRNAARDSHPRGAPRVTSSPGSGAARTAACDLPDALACFVEATAGFAAAAIQRGDLGEGRRLMEAAMEAIDTGDRDEPDLRIRPRSLG